MVFHSPFFHRSRGSAHGASMPKRPARGQPPRLPPQRRERQPPPPSPSPPPPPSPSPPPSPPPADEANDDDQYIDAYAPFALPPDADPSVGGVHVKTAWRSLAFRAAIDEGLGVYEDEEHEPRFELDEAMVGNTVQVRRLCFYLASIGKAGVRLSARAPYLAAVSPPPTAAR